MNRHINEICKNLSGDLIVTGNYLKDPQDLQDAMRGVANIIKIVNSRVYDGIFQPAGINSCPMKILNGLVSLVDNEAMRFQNIEGVHSGKNSGNQNEIDHVSHYSDKTVFDSSRFISLALSFNKL